MVLVFTKFPWPEHRMDMPCSAKILNMHHIHWSPPTTCIKVRDFHVDFLPLFSPQASGDSLYVGRWSQRWSCIGCCGFGCGHCQWLATALWRCSVSTETLMTSMKGGCIICIAWFMFLFSVDVYAFVSYQCRQQHMKWRWDLALVFWNAEGCGDWQRWRHADAICASASLCQTL